MLCRCQEKGTIFSLWLLSHYAIGQGLSGAILCPTVRNNMAIIIERL